MVSIPAKLWPTGTSTARCLPFLIAPTAMGTCQFHGVRDKTTQGKSNGLGLAPIDASSELVRPFPAPHPRSRAHRPRSTRSRSRNKLVPRLTTPKNT